MNTTATWFRSGVQQSGGYVGCVGYDGGPVVGRFAFTTPATGASSFSFRSASLNPAGSTTWASGGSDNYRWAITTGPDDMKSAIGGGNATGSAGWGSSPYMDSGATAPVSLMPNTTYYLWIFPATSGYNLWKITSVSVTLGGSYGNAASPAASNGNFGHAIPISITGGSSGATYTVTVSCAGNTETLQTQGGATIINWTPDLTTYGALLPSSRSATATISVETFYGTSSRGTQSTQIVVSFLESDVMPVTASGWFAHAPYNESRATSIAKYIEGISRSAVTFDSTKITLRYSATLAYYSVQCGSSLVTTSPYRTPVLVGQTTVTVIVTDSRGFSASETYTVTPFAYTDPSLTNATVLRCNSGGAPADDGTYFSAVATAVYSSVDGSNSVSMSLYYRSIGGSYGSATAMTSGTAVLIGGLNPDLGYEIKIVITDTIGGSGEITRTIRSQVWAMRFRPNGDGVAFGMSPQIDKRLELPDNWKLAIGNTTLSESELIALKALIS